MDNTKRNGRATSCQMHRVCSGEDKVVYKYYNKVQDFVLGKRCARKFDDLKSLKSHQEQKGEGYVVKEDSKPSQAFYTYAEEIASESYIGRTSKTEVKTRPMLWGSLMEVVLFNKLGMGWTMEHKNTILHKKYGHIWSGTPDLVAEEICAEAKCYEPKKFGLLSLCLSKKKIELVKSKFKEEYWQVVSNAVLTGKKKAMIIAFMPKRKELEEIIKKIEDTDFLEDNGLKPTDYYFMSKENIESLPYLPDDSPIDSINSFVFDVPEEDIVFMTKRIIEFEKQVQHELTY
jgi:hypothetical protein